MKSFVSRPLRIHRNGAGYDVQVIASTGGAEPAMEISLTESHDPDGVVRSTRTASFAHEARFWVDDPLAHGALRATSDQMGGRGTIDLRWAPSDALDRACAGDLARRRGSLVGDFVFHTNTPQLGTLRFGRIPGVMRRATGDPCAPARVPCPASGFAISGGDGQAALVASRHGRVASLTALIITRLSNGWLRVQSVLARVPSDHVTLGADERSGRVRGARGSWFAGANDFRSFTTSANEGPFPCGADREVRLETNDGSFLGDLEANPILGPDLTFDGYATATRVQVGR